MGRRVECAADSLEGVGFDFFFIGTGAVSHNENAAASEDLDAPCGRLFPPSFPNVFPNY
jgi:hypothetical protein